MAAAQAMGLASVGGEETWLERALACTCTLAAAYIVCHQAKWRGKWWCVKRNRRKKERKKEIRPEEPKVVLPADMRYLTLHARSASNGMLFKFSVPPAGSALAKNGVH